MGRGPRGPPLKLAIYLVKFLEKLKISIFLLLGPPLEKNRSWAPVHNEKKNYLPVSNKF